MPPLPPVPDVLKADLQWTYGSDTNVHSHLFFHYTSGAPSQADLNTFAGAIMASYVANVLPFQASSCTITQVECTDLSNITTLPGIVTASHIGGDASQTLTAETAALINFVIGRRYRGGHPRVYFPIGTAPTLNTPNQWKSSFVSGATTAFTTFINNLLGVGPPGPVCDHLANVSYHSGGAIRPTPLVDQVLSYHVNPIPGSQRRRMAR